MNHTIPNFLDLTNKMDLYLDKLQTVERDKIKGTLQGLKGVYVFFEDDVPVYVGKTDNLVRRLSEHAREGSKNNDANFAFKIAKLEWFEQNKLEEKITRKFLDQLPEFSSTFKKAKSRVGNMTMKYVPIDDPYEQYLFEFFAALHFKTKYNEFKNH